MGHNTSLQVKYLKVGLNRRWESPIAGFLNSLLDIGENKQQGSGRWAFAEINKFSIFFYNSQHL